MDDIVAIVLLLFTGSKRKIHTYMKKTILNSSNLRLCKLGDRRTTFCVTKTQLNLCHRSDRDVRKWIKKSRVQTGYLPSVIYIYICKINDYNGQREMNMLTVLV